MKIFLLLIVLSLITSCSRGRLEFMAEEGKTTGRDSIRKLPVSVWFDADTHKKDRDLSKGLKDLSLNGRNCISNIYPKIDFELPSRIPVFKSSGTNYLKCENLDLSFLNNGKFTIVLTFVPRLGTKLFSLNDGIDEVTGIYWLAGEGFIVQTGTGTEVLSQRTSTIVQSDELAVLKFTYNSDETVFTDRQKLWLNGTQVALTPVTPDLENSGEIMSSTQTLTLKASSATEISSLMIYEEALSPEQEQEVNCFLKNQFKLTYFNC